MDIRRPPVESCRPRCERVCPGHCSARRVVPHRARVVRGAAPLNPSSPITNRAGNRAADLTLSTYGIGNAGATNYSPKLASAISHLPEVKRVESWVGVSAIPLLPDGAPNLALANNEINFAASENGLYFNIDPPEPGRRVYDLGPGRPANGRAPWGGRPSRALHHPASQPFPGSYSEGTAIAALRHEASGDSGVQQRSDPRRHGQAPGECRVHPSLYQISAELQHRGHLVRDPIGSSHQDIASVEQTLLRLLPRGASGNFSLTAITEAKAERALKPESMALAMFGLIAALAALGTALPVVARQLRSTEADRQVVRALGASPATTFLDGSAGTFMAIIAGSLFGRRGGSGSVATGAIGASPTGLPPWGRRPRLGCARKWFICPHRGDRCRGGGPRVAVVALPKRPVPLFAPVALGPVGRRSGHASARGGRSSTGIRTRARPHRGTRAIRGWPAQ
jgi:hypothetical protein